MQKKHVLISMLAILTLVLSVVNTSAWVYPEPTPEDTLYEDFGPRIDRILIKLYATDTAEFTALEGEQIDLVDWPLTEYWFKRWDDPKYDYIKKVSYGADYGFRILDLNNNASIAAKGDAPCVTREIPMRQAIACLSDKTKIIADCVGAGFGIELWSLFGPGWGVYQHPDIVPAGTLESLAYLKNETRARQILTNDARFQFTAGASTYGVTSTHGDHLEWKPVETGVWEDVYLDFFIRQDDPQRKCAGEMIQTQLANSLGVYCDTSGSGDSSAAKIKVMTNKDFHMYTGGWGLSFDPDWSWYLFSVDWYWHPGRPLNYDCVNNTLFNSASYTLANAKNSSQALRCSRVASEALAAEANIVPLWETMGTMAHHRTYLGTPGVADGEDKYEGKNWTHLVNDLGAGIGVSFWGLLNMYPEGEPWGDGENMTLRWGFRVPDLRSFNPLFSEWAYDFNVLGMMYDGLLYTDPYDPSEYIDYLTTGFNETTDIGVYVRNATTGETANYIDITLNSSVLWSDGAQFDMEDVKFTLEEAMGIVAARGCPAPFALSQGAWCVDNVTITGTYTGRIWLTVESIYAWHGTMGSAIVPEHIWRTILNTRSCVDLQGWGPALDPGMVATGPFLFVEYVERSHVLLVRNPRYFKTPPAHRTAPPTARFIPKTVTCLHTPYDEDIVFDASASVSAFQAGTEYPITQYRWDFDDDGSWDHIGKTVNYTVAGGTLPITYKGHGTYFNMTTGEAGSTWKVTLEVYAPTAPAGLKIGTITNTINLIPEILMPYNFDEDCDIDIDDIRAFCDAYIIFWTHWTIDS